MAHEFQRMTRVIPLDERVHRMVLPLYYGDQVGRWERDTLVIDSVEPEEASGLGRDHTCGQNNRC